MSANGRKMYSMCIMTLLELFTQKWLNHLISGLITVNSNTESNVVLVEINRRLIDILSIHNRMPVSLTVVCLSVALSVYLTDCLFVEYDLRGNLLPNFSCLSTYQCVCVSVCLFVYSLLKSISNLNCRIFSRLNGNLFATLNFSFIQCLTAHK